MSPGELKEEAFEDAYTIVFEAIAQRHGLLINYQRDRAAQDLGLGLRKPDSYEQSGRRVWFQLKGKHTSTLNEADFLSSDSVSVSVEIDHLRFWYSSPEAVYLVVYIEAAGSFVAEDIRDIVDRQWGDAVLRPDFLHGQRTVTVRVSSSAALDDASFESMLRHRSMRIDGPSYKGRPLGHNFDPWRSSLGALEPDVFIRVVTSLLAHHQLASAAEIALSALFVGELDGLAVTGVLHDSVEVTSTLFTEFGYGADREEVRAESELHRIHGKALVVVLTGSTIPPLDSDFSSKMAEKGIEQVLLFLNVDDSVAIREGLELRQTGLLGIPVGLGGLAYLVLMSPLVFLEFQSELEWAYINYLPGAPRPQE